MKKVFSLIFAVLFAASVFAGCGANDAKPELDKTELVLTVGDTAQLSAGEASKLKWTSSDDSVATVHGGSVSAKKAGTADITVSNENGDSQVCKVTVDEKLITSINISSKSIRMGLGKTIQLSASYSPADASLNEITWSSDDSNIASVDDEGYVTGRSDGTTVIKCSSSNGVTSSCTVTVEEAPEAPTAAPTSPPSSEKPTSSTESTAPTAASESTPAPSYPGDFLFPDSSTRKLSESEVSATFASLSGTPVSGSYSQEAVNEIFARHGYVFRTPAIKAYYESKSWYRPDPNFNLYDLSEIEEYNINLFSKYDN